MSVLTDLIYGGSHAVAGLTEGAVNDAIAKYGADHPIAFPDTAYFFPTIYAATGVKVKTLGDLPACVGVLKSLITDQEDLGQALNAGLATAVGAEILEGLKFAEPKDAYEQAAVPGIGFVPDPIIRSLGVPLVTGDIPGVAVILGGTGKNFGNSASCRSNINLILRLLETAVNRRPACEFAEARSLERICDNLAFVVGGEIHKTVIFAPVDPAAGLLTPYIV